MTFYILHNSFRWRFCTHCEASPSMGNDRQWTTTATTATSVTTAVATAIKHNQVLLKEQRRKWMEERKKVRKVSRWKERETKWRRYLQNLRRKQLFPLRQNRTTRSKAKPLPTMTCKKVSTDLTVWVVITTTPMTKTKVQLVIFRFPGSLRSPLSQAWSTCHRGCSRGSAPSRDRPERDPPTQTSPSRRTARTRVPTSSFRQKLTGTRLIRQTRAGIHRGVPRRPRPSVTHCQLLEDADLQTSWAPQVGLTRSVQVGSTPSRMFIARKCIWIQIKVRSRGQFLKELNNSWIILACASQISSTFWNILMWQHFHQRFDVSPIVFIPFVKNHLLLWWKKNVCNSLLGLRQKLCFWLDPLHLFTILSFNDDAQKNPSILKKVRHKKVSTHLCEEEDDL